MVDLETVLKINNLGKIPESNLIDMANIKESEKNKISEKMPWVGQYCYSDNERFFPIAFGVGLFKRNYNIKIDDPQIMDGKITSYSLSFNPTRYATDTRL